MKNCLETATSALVKSLCSLAKADGREELLD
jgi:hypothetical protein